MGLPSVSLPKFDVVVPSTGKTIKFRPFLVREEKILLMALEGGEISSIVDAVLDIVDSCTFNSLDIQKLTKFDLEFLFLKIRSKSVGEVIEVRVGHQDPDNQCKIKTEVKINIDDIKLAVDLDNSKIALSSGIGIKMRYPSFKEFSSIKKGVASSLGLIQSCCEYIYDSSNIYDIKDFTQKELADWFDKLPQKDFDKIKDFFKQQPKLTHKVSWKCKCGVEDHFTLEGIESFFVYR